MVAVGDDDDANAVGEAEEHDANVHAKPTVAPRLDLFPPDCPWSFPRRWAVGEALMMHVPPLQPRGMAATLQRAVLAGDRANDQVDSVKLAVVKTPASPGSRSAVRFGSKVHEQVDCHHTPGGDIVDAEGLMAVDCDLLGQQSDWEAAGCFPVRWLQSGSPEEQVEGEVEDPDSEGQAEAGREVKPCEDVDAPSSDEAPSRDALGHEVVDIQVQ
jgi:hypothetical protein